AAGGSAPSAAAGRPDRRRVLAGGVAVPAAAADGAEGDAADVREPGGVRRRLLVLRPGAVGAGDGGGAVADAALPAGAAGPDDAGFGADARRGRRRRVGLRRALPALSTLPSRRPASLP